jgi:UDP-N-acetylmuramate dehydrogenase
MDHGERQAMNMVEHQYLLRGELREHEPMARHLSWRVGGRADHAYFPADLEDLCGFVASRPGQEPLYFVGLGSNLLVRDGGLRGSVILTQNALKSLRLDGDVIDAEAGVPSPKVARFAAAGGFEGAEFLAGIPGTVGGALAMNAGCYGGETWNIVETATTIDRAGRLRQRMRDDYDIGYRTVKLRAGGEEWFVAARLRLLRGDGAKASATIKHLLERRMAVQPLDQPNAGSVFRNPPGEHAAHLIEACGLKGYAHGGAMISDKHANFIINRGDACAADIEALIELAEKAVREKFCIVLKREVRIVGEPA